MSFNGKKGNGEIVWGWALALLGALAISGLIGSLYLIVQQ